MDAEYAKKMMEILNNSSNKKKNKHSSNFHGWECVTMKDSLSPQKLQSVKQKSTPYPTARKIKLSSKPVKNPILLDTSEDNGGTNKDMEEYDYDIWFPSPSNTPQRSDKKNKNATETLGHSKRKTVSFLETCKSHKQILKRQATPYHLSNKKFKENTCDDVKQVLFKKEKIESDSDSSSSEIWSDSKLPCKLSLSKNRKQVPGKSKHENKLKKSKKRVNNDNYDMSVPKLICKKEKIEATGDMSATELISKKVKCEATIDMSATELISKKVKCEATVDMSVTELICKKVKCEATVSNTNFLLPDSHSDSEHVYNSDEFQINNIDCSNSIVDRNINLDTSCQIVGNDQQCEENIIIVDESADAESAFGADMSEEDAPVEVALYTRNKSANINAETGQVAYFSLTNALLIVLQNNSKLYFHGFMAVNVLYGEVEVLGFTLTSSNNSVDVFSPRGSSFLYFSVNNRNKSTVVRNGLTDKLYNLGMDSESVKELYQNFKVDSTVILCKEINNVEIAFMRKHISQQLYPKCEDKIPQCVFQNKIGSWDVLKSDNQWDLMVQSIDVSSKTFICGGKGVGKSTMLKYMINRLLMKHSRILVIDLDPGQPEFTLPGCVSATIITEPVFGPNYTHLRKPHRCLFVSNVNVLHQLDGYLNSVKQLILSCSDFPEMPTLINYMGFTRGYGLEIFSAVIAYTQPTKVVQIKSSIDGRNFRKQLTYELILDISRTLVPETETIPHFDIVNILSMADENESWSSQPRQIREMCVLSYLGKILPENVSSLTEKEVPVVVIDLSNIKLVCNDKIVPPAVVNGNLVALCYLKCRNYVCLGWGVVRGIDLSTNELYLITPVCPNELEQVDHLIVGSVALPPSVYMTADNNSGLTPYTSEGVLTSLGHIPKRSYLPANSN